MGTRPDSIPIDKVESLLCCPVCLEPPQDPRTLPCFHSYCKDCLGKYVAKHRKNAAKAGKKIEEFECPSCRSLFSLKENEEVANMRGSHFVRNMVDVLNAEREANVWKCSNHSEKPSCCRCVSCEASLCEECLKTHESWPAFKSHSVLTLEELRKPENQSKITGAMRCKEHSTKKLKFYCESCQVLICRYCMDFNHLRPDHLCHPIEKVVEKHREALKSCCDALNKEQTEGEKLLKNFTEAEEALKKTTDCAKDEISKQKNDILKAVDDVFQSKIDEVDHLYAKHGKQLAEQRCKVESFLDKVKCVDNISKNMLHKGSDEEIIESHKMVEERVEIVENESKSIKKLSQPVSVHQNWFEAEQVNVAKVSDLFGKVFNISTLFSNSSILENAECIVRMFMFEWFNRIGPPWKNCYRASRDGWNASDFHARCDNKGATVTLVKVDNNIFGGYTDIDWQVGGVRQSKNAFMFSLKNKDNLPPFKASILKEEEATTNNSKLGPLFGMGGYEAEHDLFVSKHPPTIKCYSDLGHAYKLPDGYEKGTEKARCLLAGSFKFTPNEIEVFCNTLTTCITTFDTDLSDSDSIFVD